MKTSPAVWLVLAGLIAWLGLRRFEHAMLFHPRRVIDAHPGTVGLKHEAQWLTAADGVKIRAWWIPAKKDDAPALLCLHGNGGNLSSRVDKMKIFHDLGAAQLWLDWRGYGESAGAPDEQGLYRDAEAGRAWLAARVPPARLFLYGESLGAGPAVQLAARGGAAGLIIDSGFTSIPEMARLVLGFPGSEYIPSFRFDNLAKLPRVNMPVLILHSPEDDVIPFAMARRNLAAAKEPKRFVELKGGHNDGFLETGPAYGRAIADFLTAFASKS